MPSESWHFEGDGVTFASSNSAYTRTFPFLRSKITDEDQESATGIRWSDRTRISFPGLQGTTAAVPALDWEDLRDRLNADVKSRELYLEVWPLEYPRVQPRCLASVRDSNAVRFKLWLEPDGTVVYDDLLGGTVRSEEKLQIGVISEVHASAQGIVITPLDTWHDIV